MLAGRKTPTTNQFKLPRDSHPGYSVRVSWIGYCSLCIYIYIHIYKHINWRKLIRERILTVSTISRHTARDCDCACACHFASPATCRACTAGYTRIAKIQAWGDICSFTWIVGELRSVSGCLLGISAQNMYTGCYRQQKCGEKRDRYYL